MKLQKKVVSISIAILFIGAVAFNVQMNADQNQNQTSKVTMENIEALTSSASEVSIGCICKHINTNLYCYFDCPECGKGDLLCNND